MFQAACGQCSSPYMRHLHLLWLTEPITLFWSLLWVAGKTPEGRSRQGSSSDMTVCSLGRSSKKWKLDKVLEHLLIEKRKRGRKRLRVVSRGFLLQFHPRSQISCNGKLDYSLLLNVLPVLLCNIFTVLRTLFFILFVSIREGWGVTITIKMKEIRERHCGWCMVPSH